MTVTSVLVLLFGALVLWGGLALALSIALRAGKNGK